MSHYVNSILNNIKNVMYDDVNSSSSSASNSDMEIEEEKTSSVKETHPSKKELLENVNSKFINEKYPGDINLGTIYELHNIFHQKVQQCN